MARRKKTAGAVPTTSSNARTAESVRAKIEKASPRTIYTGAEIENKKIPRIPSGSFVFDMLTGGGIPQDRLTVFHGPKSSSKTTFATRIAGQYQMLHPEKTIVYVDFEGTFDKEWGSKFIPNIDKVHFVWPDYGEQGVDIIKAYTSEADDVGLIIIDSLAGIEPAQLMDVNAAEFTQWNSQIRLINRLLSQLSIRLNQIRKQDDQNLTVLAINQIRANMNKVGLYGSPYSQPGGKKLEHACSMDVQFYTGRYTHTQGVPVKVTHKFLVDKNKVGLPKRTGELSFYLVDIDGHAVGEMDEMKVVLSYAKRAGIVRREGAKWVIPTKPEPLSFDNLIAVTTHLDNTPKVYAALKKATIKACIANPFLSADEEKS